MNGILVIDKPQNYTSFDIIAILRKKFNQKKIGHMGTLDPMATGVLPILFGETAKFQIFTKISDKEYIAKMQLGIQTDSLDITGKILNNKTSNIKKEEFIKSLTNFIGKIEQIPPMFSAIKKNGKKLYELARQGIEIEREKRKINISALELLTFDEENQTADIKITCSPGTYIRTLCADIGDLLKCGAAVSQLRRIQSNGFDESKSIPINMIQNYSLSEIKEKYMFPTEHFFQDNISIYITTAQKSRFRNGGSLSIDRVFSNIPIENSEICKVYCNDIFLGLGKVVPESKEIKVLKCLTT